MTMTASAPGGVTRLGPGGGTVFVPPLEEYELLSPTWIEQEHRYFEGAATSHFGGYWAGEPGAVRFDSWPYLEICVILTGAVAVAEHDGQTHEFVAGDAFSVAPGTAADWITRESSTKIFVAITLAE